MTATNEVTISNTDTEQEATPPQNNGARWSSPYVNVIHRRGNSVSRPANPTRRHTVATVSEAVAPLSERSAWTAWCDPWVDFCDDLECQNVAMARRHSERPSHLEEGRNTIANKAVLTPETTAISEETDPLLDSRGSQGSDLPSNASITADADDPPVVKAVAGTNSWFTTTINLLMNTLGSTVLFLPAMYASLGWVFAPLLLTLAGSLSFFSGYILSETIDTYEERGHTIIKFGDIATAAIGPGKWLTIVTDYFGHLTIFCSLIILLNFFTQVMFYMLPVVPYRLWMLILAGGFFIPVAMIRRGKWLSKGSVVGAIGTILIVVGIPAAAIYGFCSDDGVVVEHSILPKETMKVFAMFNTFLFMFGPSALYPTIKAGMKDRTKFNSANLVAHALSLAVYLLAGLLAYGAFGNSVSDNVIYSMGSLEKRDIPNVDSLPTWDQNHLDRWWVGWPVAIAMVCCCVVAAPVRFLAFFSGVVKTHPFLEKNVCVNTCFRVVAVVLVLFLTIIVPNLSILMGLVTSLVSPILKFTLSGLYYRKAKQVKGETFPTWMWVVPAFGIVCAGLGFAMSVIAVVNIEHQDEGAVFSDFFGTSRGMRVLLSDEKIMKEREL